MRKMRMALLAGALAFGGGARAEGNIAQREFEQRFAGYRACFLLYSLDEARMVSQYNPDGRCAERLAANSTFKIPLSLMAFDQGLITQRTVFPWDGVKRDLPAWNRDQTPQSWLRESTVWVSQRLATQLGRTRVQCYLDGFAYGNRDLSGDPGRDNGLTHAWLSGSLRLSGREQLAFLEAMAEGRLPVSPQAVAATRQNLYLGKLASGADYYGKTGAGRHKTRPGDARPNLRRDGWFVGFVEAKGRRYVFVSNLTDKRPPSPGDKAFGSGILKPIALDLLNRYFAAAG